jgi:hypothetical protein
METIDPQQDWTETASERLDRADEADAEDRLKVLEEINEKLEAELDLDRPRPAGATGEAEEGGEARPPGR